MPAISAKWHKCAIRQPGLSLRGRRPKACRFVAADSVAAVHLACGSCCRCGHQALHSDAHWHTSLCVHQMLAHANALIGAKETADVVYHLRGVAQHVFVCSGDVQSVSMECGADMHQKKNCGAAALPHESFCSCHVPPHLMHAAGAHRRMLKVRFSCAAAHENAEAILRRRKSECGADMHQKKNCGAAALPHESFCSCHVPPHLMHAAGAHRRISCMRLELTAAC